MCFSLVRSTLQYATCRYRVDFGAQPVNHGLFVSVSCYPGGILQSLLVLYRFALILSNHVSCIQSGWTGLVAALHVACASTRAVL